jgi:SAM-dependent methyltransferase
MNGMVDQTGRYDKRAQGYVRWWAPILAPAAHDLLAGLAPSLVGDEAILDIGTGTAQLALGALEQWLAATVIGVDPSAGMCAVADAVADQRLSGDNRARFRTVVASAEALPFPDHSFDAALSSFVFHLVPSRTRAFAEARRVLRPGGIFAWVTWLVDEHLFLPSATFDAVLDDVGIGARQKRDRSGDVPSVDCAADEMRRAGFGDVEAHLGWTAHRFTIDGYIGFLTDYDEEARFGGLSPRLRNLVIETMRARLSDASTEQMTMRFPIVFASGRR